MVLSASLIDAAHLIEMCSIDFSKMKFQQIFENDIIYCITSFFILDQSDRPRGSPTRLIESGPQARIRVDLVRKQR